MIPFSRGTSYVASRPVRGAGMLIVKTEEFRDVDGPTRRVVLFGFMETTDRRHLCRALAPGAGTQFRLIAERIWRCEPRCVQSMLLSARSIRASGGTFVWVSPAPVLRQHLAEIGEAEHIVASDPIDRSLTADWM